MINTTHTGLTQEDAASNLQRFGYNVLPKHPAPSSISILLSQIRNPLIYVLILSGLTTLLLQHISDSLIIFFAVFLNTILGFVQEKKANQAFRALQQFVSRTTEVIRDGNRIKIPVEHVTLHDVVTLSQGSKIPADGEILFANRVFIDEAIITGESNPALKNEHDAVYMGTTVSAGQAIMRVTAIGSQTKIGSIAQQIQTTGSKTPLQRQLNTFSKKLVVFILSLVLLIFVIGIIRGKSIQDMFITSVALAVSSIPEGLAVSLTVVLAVGMQNILKRKGLVRKLASAETLGGVTTICVDKTGTLTQGKMSVVSTHGNEQDIAQQVLLANDLDDPIVIAAYAWAQKILNPNLLKHHHRLDSIPFSPIERFFVGLYHWTPQSNMIFVNGAPEILLEWSTLSPEEKANIIKEIDNLTSQGRRVIGLARKQVSETKTSLTLDDAKNDLTWVGLVAFFDPVRPSVQEALSAARQAGIRILVITGDYPKTTEFVLQEIGLPTKKHEIMTGDALRKLSINELSLKLHDIHLFARITPDQKYMIVEALQKNGEVVAMLGDGVNDAPALHKADIGIVVSDASDVARETADVILLDSNFSTIVAAVEEGRAIFDNIRKIILYLLCDSFTEIILVIGSILLGFPLPITAVQIIWINLISDGFPGLALTIDPKHQDIMLAPPRHPSEKIVSSWMVYLIGIVSGLAGIMTLIVFIVTLKISGSLEVARTMTFLTLGLNSLAYVFSVKSLLIPFWKDHLFKNKWLILSVFLGFILLIIPFSTSATRMFFGITWVSLWYWITALCLSIMLFIVVEIFKIAYSYIRQKSQH